MPGVLGVFSHMDCLIDGINDLKESGRKKVKVFSPAPFHQIEHALDEPTSPVRLFTLIGGLTGCAFGYLFTSYTSLDWILPTSGKSVVSLVAYTVIAFELTVLFGSIFTMIGIFLNAKLMTKHNTLYDDRFTEDKFGIFVPCAPSEYESVSQMLTQNGAEEVKHA
jgi:molybdopterin-containing oxidoreductase family membrane subunit